MLLIMIKFLLINSALYANVCEVLFISNDVHLSKADQAIQVLSEKYSNWHELSLKKTQFANSLKNQKVSMVTLRSSDQFQHYRIELVEGVVERVDVSALNHSISLKLKNRAEAVPWARIQKLFIDPEKISKSIFNESEKSFKLYHLSNQFKQSCIGCKELGEYVASGYRLSNSFKSYNELMIVFYDHINKKIRSLKSVTIVQRNDTFYIKSNKTGTQWRVPHHEVGYVGLSLPHGD